MVEEQNHIHPSRPGRGKECAHPPPITMRRELGGGVQRAILISSASPLCHMCRLHCMRTGRL